MINAVTDALCEFLLLINRNLARFQQMLNLFPYSRFSKRTENSFVHDVDELSVVLNVVHGEECGVQSLQKIIQRRLQSDLAWSPAPLPAWQIAPLCQ